MPRFLPHARLLAACTLLVALVGGCDDEELLTPDPPPTGQMFARYVAIGNSITAGFQSAGINQSLQDDAYPVLLAEQMGTTFFIPELRDPGCPPPLTQIFPAPQRLGGAGSDVCALRDTPLPPFVSNVAVPGAEVVDVLSNLNPSSNANPLTTLILGGRTQLEAALEVDPTFASVWIGNNDVLGAALAGNPERITDDADFRERYGQILDGLSEAPSLEGALLVSVADVTAIPALSAGAAYAQALPAAQAAGAAPPNLQVDSSCAPDQQGMQTLIPFQHGATLLQVATALAQQFGQNAPILTIDCAQDRTVAEVVAAAFAPNPVPEDIEAAIAGTRGISLLTLPEIGVLQQAVASFNAFIQSQADQRGWAHLDANALFEANAQLIPPFPELVENPQTPWGPDQPFGPLFSLDGVHPSTQAHRIVADAAIAAINAEYGTSIPALAN